MSIKPIITLLAAILLAFLPLRAYASGGGLSTTGDSVVLKAYGHRATPSRGPASKKSAATGQKGSSKPDQYQARLNSYRSKLNAAIDFNKAAAAAEQACLASNAAADCDYPRRLLPSDPEGAEINPLPGTEPALSPQQAAYVALARLRLTAPEPMIGPSPDLNEWKMAAVGYPLWLWADGNLDPAPVTDSVYDISVGLDAHLVKVVFDMGDGHKVTCTDVSRQWTSAVAAGAESPSCGHRYQKPSLPAGSYTVTANAVWAIDWNVNGTTGTIPFYQSASTTIPVGELQVLVR